MKLTITLLLAAMFGGAAFAADGKALYDAGCKKCHGADGTPNAGVMKMTKTTMAHLGSAEVQKISDADLKTIIVKGRGKMKAIAMPDGDAAAVVAFMRTLKK